MSAAAALGTHMIEKIMQSVEYPPGTPVAAACINELVVMSRKK